MPKISLLPRVTSAEVNDNEFLILNTVDYTGQDVTRRISVDDLMTAVVREKIDGNFAPAGSGEGSGTVELPSNLVYYKENAQGLMLKDEDNNILKSLEKMTSYDENYGLYAGTVLNTIMSNGAIDIVNSWVLDGVPMPNDMVTYSSRTGLTAGTDTNDVLQLIVYADLNDELHIGSPTGQSIDIGNGGSNTDLSNVEERIDMLESTIAIYNSHVLCNWGESYAMGIGPTYTNGTDALRIEGGFNMTLSSNSSTPAVYTRTDPWGGTTLYYKDADNNEQTLITLGDLEHLVCFPTDSYSPYFVGGFNEDIANSSYIEAAIYTMTNGHLVTYEDGVITFGTAGNSYDQQLNISDIVTVDNINDIIPSTIVTYNDNSLYSNNQELIDVSFVSHLKNWVVLMTDNTASTRVYTGYVDPDNPSLMNMFGAAQDSLDLTTATYILCYRDNEIGYLSDGSSNWYSIPPLIDALLDVDNSYFSSLAHTLCSSTSYILSLVDAIIADNSAFTNLASAIRTYND